MRQQPWLGHGICMLLLVSCGGGGGSSPTPAATTVAVPTAAVSAVSATVLKTGESVSIRGSDLQRAVRFLVGGKALRVLSNDGSTVQAQAPDAAVSGALAVEDTAGTQRTTAYELRVYAPVAVTSVAPQRGVAGTTVTVTGQALDTVTGVSFGAAAATIVTATPTSLAVQVPADAPSGVLTLRTAYETAQTGVAFTVVPTATVTAISALAGPGGMQLTVAGSHLDRVTQVRVGGTAAPIAQQSDTRLVALPTTEGAVTLEIDGQGVLAVGSYSQAGAASVAVGALEVAQGFLFAGNEAALRLTPGKPVLARVRLTASAAGGIAPTVTLVGLRADLSMIGQVPMTGPATLPTSVADADLAASFVATTPPSWVAPGLSLRVDVGGIPGAAQPLTVGSAARIDLVLVPIVIGGITPTLPALDAVHARLVRLYPYAADRISVTVAAPWVGGSGAFTSMADVGNLLIALESKRQAEAPGRVYYGIWPAMQSGAVSTSGLGFVNNASWALGASTTAVGMDGFQSSFVGPGTPNPFNAQVSTGLAVMAHEIGHVLGLAHAPCGGAAGPDPAYPYAGGQLGARTLYDSSYVDGEVGVLASPRVGGVMATDLMGYCSGVQISDFNYALARQFAEAHTAAFPVAAAGPGVSAAAVRTAVEAPALLAVAGQILAEGVHLQPLAATTVRRVLPTPSRATWLLRLTTAAGETIDVPFQPLALSHGEAVSFFVTVPMPASAVTDVQVLRSGVALPKVARVS